jgi:patatin-like phospholipase/acyl hydrolase
MNCNMLFLFFISLIFVNSKLDNCNILSLSGGGSFGAVELGILEKLDNKNYDLISGISVGALNACYLSYYDKNNFTIGLDNLKDIYINLKNDDIYVPNFHFNYKNISKIGFFDTTPLHNTINKILSKFNYQNIITVLIGSTNLNNGNLDIFFLNNYTNKEQSELLMTSSAIPLVFPPRIWNNNVYVDGGVITNSILNGLDSFIDCNFYNITYISSSDKLSIVENIDNLETLIKRLVEVIYSDFNNELSEFININCKYPRGIINYCFPDNEKLKNYSILDFTKGKELINIGRNHHYCVKINYC